MPIYEYSCRGCGHEFEAFIRGSTAKPPAVCPACAGVELERVFSLPVIASETTRAIIRKETKQRDRNQAVDRAHEQRKYELSHED